CNLSASLFCSHPSVSYIFPSVSDHRHLHSLPTRRSSDLLAIIPNERTGTDLHVNLKCTNVTTVQADHSVICAQKQEKGTTEESILMKSGSPKKNMYVRSFQMRKLVNLRQT